MSTRIKAVKATVAAGDNRTKAIYIPQDTVGLGIHVSGMDTNSYVKLEVYAADDMPTGDDHGIDELKATETDGWEYLYLEAGSARNLIGNSQNGFTYLPDVKSLRGMYVRIFISADQGTETAVRFLVNG